MSVLENKNLHGKSEAKRDLEMIALVVGVIVMLVTIGSFLFGDRIYFRLFRYTNQAAIVQSADNNTTTFESNRKTVPSNLDQAIPVNPKFSNQASIAVANAIQEALQRKLSIAGGSLRGSPKIVVGGTPVSPIDQTYAIDTEVIFVLNSQQVNCQSSRMLGSLRDKAEFIASKVVAEFSATSSGVVQCPL